MQVFFLHKAFWVGNQVFRWHSQRKELRKLKGFLNHLVLDRMFVKQARKTKDPSQKPVMLRIE